MWFLFVNNSSYHGMVRVLVLSEFQTQIQIHITKYYNKNEQKVLAP